MTASGPPPPPPPPGQRAPAPPPPREPLASAPPPTPGTGWYSGPIPIAGLAPRETVGSAIGRTLVKSLTVLAVVLLGFLAIPLVLIAIGAALAGGGAEAAGTPRTLVAGQRGADIRLVAVPITGVILGEDRGDGASLFGAIDATYGYAIKEELARLASDDSVDGIVLEVDTPGGTVFGARAIADGLAAYQADTGNPVVAHVGGISASGGVYAMAGADAIFADHGTLVGSIGVIFGPIRYYDGVTAIDGGILGGGVTTEDGIEVEYLTAGRSKDLGNPYRPMTGEERAVLQEGLDDAYDEFVAHVGESRGLTGPEIRKELGALLFGEQQAVANGLIDGVADRDRAYRLAAEAAGLGDRETWSVERLDTPEIGLLDLLAQDGVAGDAGRATGGSAGAGGDTGAGGALGAHPLCLGTGAILAYHGDPARLCQPGG